jgi:isopenicillin N synthase-like dioxygenase
LRLINQIPIDHIFELNPIASAPAFMEMHKALLRNFMSKSRHICATILSCLSDTLAVSAEDRFENHHRYDQQSNTSLVMTKYAKKSLSDLNIGQNAHTDLGSLTLLFSSQWGLQVFEPEANDWAFVAPLVGHAVVNVGDSLRFFSNCVLRSSLHRVVPDSTDDQARYSLAFFLRPVRDAMMQNSEGERCSAQDWHEKKFQNYMESHETQRMTSIQTGGVGTVGVWGT